MKLHSYLFEKRMARSLIFLIVIVIAFLMIFPHASAQETIIMPYNPDSAVIIDGTIEEGEYENFFTDPFTEMIVHWEHDNTYMHVGLISPGVGWVAIGFTSLWAFGHEGPTGGTNMILGTIENDGSFKIYDHVGKGYGHENASIFNVVEAAGTRDNKVVVEFKYPLKFSENDPYEISELKPGELYTYILAYHETSTDLSLMHSRVSYGEFFVGDNLPPTDEPPSPTGEPSTLSRIVLASMAVLVIVVSFVIWRKIMS
ncbi:MAG: DOMON domain-containing protein [Candidatus Hadarchaeaceae archaeon]